jgi:hypothetical protein
MKADNSSDISEDSTQYYSIAEAMKLVTHPFDSDKRKLREFIENVDVVFGLVKAILEENYATRHTLDYYACKMFSARQGKNESIASWENKIDELQTDLREAARRVCKPEELLGAMGLINHLGKACLYRDCTTNVYKL